MSKTFNLGSSVLSGGVEGLVISMLQNVGSIASEKGADFLKSRMFGFGVNDEKLFFAASVYALKKEMIDQKNYLRIVRLIRGLSEEKQKRVVLIIGGEEQEITETFTGKDDKGKKVTKKVSYKANIAGAGALAMLGKMTDDEINEVLESSGATRIFMEKFRNKAKAYFRKSLTEFNSDAKQFFAKETWLQKKLKEAKEKRGI